MRLRRGDRDLAVSVARTDRRVAEQPHRAPIDRFDDGIYYVDLSRAPMSDINAVMNRLAAAPGVVFDLRGYPRTNHGVLSHLVTHIDDLKGWELIPLVIRPDSGSAPVAWEDTSTWNMPAISVMQPHIGGRVAFLTGPRAASYSESIMALVEHYRLGAIVGVATTGTNGDIAQIMMPTGCSTFFTGRRVTRPDGTRHHLLGIQPTIPASRTLAGLTAGRDEVLEKGVAYVRGASK
jgi:C-terminal processing protease CtpA/Prc